MEEVEGRGHGASNWRVTPADMILANSLDYKVYSINALLPIVSPQGRDVHMVH